MFLACKNVSVLYGAGADPIWSEPESAPGPRTFGAGAAQKSGGSPTLVVTGATFSVQINQSVVGDRVFVLTGATFSAQINQSISRRRQSLLGNRGNFLCTNQLINQS